MRLAISILILAATCLAVPLWGGGNGIAGILTLFSPNEEWRWITLSASSGLPPGRVVAMESDGDGYVWIATDRGVAWFDGYQFLPPFTGGDGSVTGYVRQIVCKENGDIAIQTVDAIWTGRSGKLRRLRGPEDTGTIAPLGAEDLYVAGRKAHYRVHGNQWTPLTVAGANIRLYPGAGGRPWILVPRTGLFHWDGQQWPAKPVLTVGTSFDSLADGGGLLTVAVKSPVEAAGHWEVDESAGGGPRRIHLDIARLVALDSSAAGVATFDSGDVKVRSGGIWKSLGNSFSAALLRRSTSLLLRRNGDIWAGTNGGINVFRSQTARLRHSQYSSGDGRNNVHELLRRRNGELWMATSDGIVVLSPSGESRTIPEIAGTHLGVVTGLGEDSDGRVWVSSGSSFGGAFRQDGASWQHVLKKDGLTNLPVHRIKKDRSGNLWFLSNMGTFEGESGDTGAFRWKEMGFQFFGKAMGMPDASVSSFDEGPDGALWFGTTSGLIRLKNGVWEEHFSLSGLRQRVFDLSVAPDGTVWFCHQRAPMGVGRLIRRPDGTAETRYFNDSDGVPSREVWAVYTESDGRVWASTANGVGVYRGNSWVAAGSGYGIEGIRTWALLLEKNDLWFGSLGQGVFRLSRSERLDANPRLFLQAPMQTDQNWTVGWRALARGGTIRPADILTRYRVDDGDWQAWTARREVSIPASDSGTHRVEVQAVGALGDVEPVPASLIFSIPYPLYLRWEFLVPVGLLLAAAGALAFQAVRSRLRYTRELEIAKNNAEASGRARSVFLAMMSHEIRTPMNGVLGMTTVMLDTALDLRQRDYMNTIRNSAEALLSVINDVLDFSKIESGTFQIELAPFNLEEVCEQVATLLAARANEKSLLLTVDYPAGLPAIVVGDGGRVRQILLNLAGNAIKFTDAGFVRISVERAVAGDAPMRLRIQVEDSGIGIAAEKIPLLFREFSQVDSSAGRRHGGTGLGLAISKKLAGHMGGAITVESVPGAGATFICELPFGLGPPLEPPPLLTGHCLILHPSPAIRDTLGVFCRDIGFIVDVCSELESCPGEPFDAVLVAEEWYLDVFARLGAACGRILNIDERHSASLLTPLSRSRIRTALAPGEIRPVAALLRQPDPVVRSRMLVVEDNLTNQRVIRLLLEKLGFAVVVVGDGEQAVQLCRHQLFDLVFMDMQMPVMDGLEATRRLRLLPPPNGRVPILALTANAMDDDRQRCTDAGMSGFLAKPIVRNELLAALRQHLPAASIQNV